MRISDHARQRAQERGFPNSSLQKAVRQLANSPDGVYKQQSGHSLVVKNQTVVTILSPGMTWDTRS